MIIEVSVVGRTEILIDGKDSDESVVVHFGDQDLKVEGGVEATVSLLHSFEYEADTSEINLPESVIQTCQALELDSVHTLQSLFDALEEMEKDMNFQEGTQCKK